MRAGFLCSNFYGFDAFRRLVRDERIEPVFVVSLDETRFAESGMRSYYYQGTRYFAYALGAGILSLLTRDLNGDARVLRAARDADADFVFAIGWPDIIRGEALGIATHGIVAVHPSQLPLYRGGAPLNWQLIDRRPTIGVSSFFIEEEVDTGNVLVQREYAVPPGNVATFVDDVYERAFYEVLDETVERLERGERGTPQDLSQGFYRPRRRPEQGRIDFREPADAVVAFVRALTFPFPGAFVEHRGLRLIVNEACATTPAVSGTAGQVLAVDDFGCDVACGTGAVRLTGLVDEALQQPELEAVVAAGDVIAPPPGR